ncbi:Na+/H+ antiporter, putative [Acaryochloris marina MBIC11017]|uniref:Na+/H+ antiporter, putative n=1 Tax=Acaryochloris marina (strain MBIC 11017) TaxID=329726 RepID=B0BZT9_ACAM1|nr:Na+/H+ antiporter, putative [Acaryochloris marina MBIC11017]BDM81905.1 hypothetical protein AM10699_47690 [Acaryochloris marina MBIC10699]
MIIVAIIGRVITGFTILGQPEINRLAIGVGMIPRGEVGLVFAGVGSASGTLSRPLEAAIISYGDFNNVSSTTHAARCIPVVRYR